MILDLCNEPQLYMSLHSKEVKWDLDECGESKLATGGMMVENEVFTYGSMPTKPLSNYPIKVNQFLLST